MQFHLKLYVSRTKKKKKIDRWDELYLTSNPNISESDVQRFSFPNSNKYIIAQRFTFNLNTLILLLPAVRRKQFREPYA